MDDEIELTGGNSNSAVVKVGNTVRRSMSAPSPSVHRLLKHLEECGFEKSPKFLGIDDEGREILSFIPGSCEITATAWKSETTLVSAANLLRDLHEALTQYPTKPDDIWRYEYLDKNQHEVICHNDFGLYNVVIQDNSCIGVIDFDLAGPGPRLRDIAYAAYWFVPLSQAAEDMRKYAIADVENGSRRFKSFCRAYGVCPNKELLDMTGEVLHEMADEKLMRDLIGEEQTVKLKLDGHLDHWAREAHEFKQYRHTIHTEG